MKKMLFLLVAILYSHTAIICTNLVDIQITKTISGEYTTYTFLYPKIGLNVSTTYDNKTKSYTCNAYDGKIKLNFTEDPKEYFIEIEEDFNRFLSTKKISGSKYKNRKYIF